MTDSLSATYIMKSIFYDGDPKPGRIGSHNRICGNFDFYATARARPWERERFNSL